PGALEAPQSETLALAVALARIRSMPELVERLSTEIQRLTGAQSASTFFRFHNTWSGFSTDDRLRRQLVKSLPKENRLAAQVLKLGVPVVITDTSLRQEDAGPMVIEAGIRSFALLPIRTDGEVGGLLYLNYEEPDQANMVFESERGRTIELMLTCAGVSASAINQKTVLEDASALDPLTGAYSLRQLEQLLETEINRGRRYRYSVALLSFDIDNFAEVNDKFGQAAGDGVLQYVAKRVLEMGRGSDILARRGSDDFMLMLPQTTGKGAESMARRIHQAFENPVTAGDYRVRITLSIGMASFPERADDAAELLNAAEIALYSAKAQGKNRTSVADTLSLGS
ncbi:MAG TPA: sensor domain-containing diguanylate cyclase, partial [Chloroflexota bacterium]|nr:sensor domain-containing diguanylate cyclase [Chloroflexota bacterium]